MELRTGNLFAVESGVALAHGCNCIGAMGAGIALQFKERYPEMYREYRLKCLQGKFIPGDAFIWKAPSYPPGGGLDRWIINLASQDKPGPYARVEWITQALQTAIRTFPVPISSIAMPKIGCGIGGLTWKKVAPALESLEVTENVTFIVYSL